MHPTREPGKTSHFHPTMVLRPVGGSDHKVQPDTAGGGEPEELCGRKEGELNEEGAKRKTIGMVGQPTQREGYIYCILLGLVTTAS